MRPLRKHFAFFKKRSRGRLTLICLSGACIVIFASVALAVVLSVMFKL